MKLVVPNWKLDNVVKLNAVNCPAVTVTPGVWGVPTATVKVLLLNANELEPCSVSTSVDVLYWTPNWLLLNVSPPTVKSVSNEI